MRKVTYFCTLTLLIASVTGCHMAADSGTNADIFTVNTAASVSSDIAQTTVENAAASTAVASVSVVLADIYKAYSDILVQYANDINKAEKYNILEGRGKPIYIGDLTGDGTPELAFLAAPADRTSTTEILRMFSYDSGIAKLICEEYFGGGIDHVEYYALCISADNTFYVATYQEGASSNESYYKLLPDESGMYTSSDRILYHEYACWNPELYTVGYTAEQFESEVNALITSIKIVPLCNLGFDDSVTERANTLVSLSDASGSIGYVDAQTILGGDSQLPYMNYDGEYILPNSDRRYMNESDLVSLTSDELRIARNEIYARYNCMFKDFNLSEYFRQYSWYDGYGHYYASDLPVKSMNEYEQYNLNLIMAAENNTASIESENNPESDADAQTVSPTIEESAGDTAPENYVYTITTGVTYSASAYEWIPQESQGLRNPFLYIIEHQYSQHLDGERDIFVLDAGDKTVMDASVDTYDEEGFEYYGRWTTYNHGGGAYSFWNSPNGLCAVRSSYKWNQSIETLYYPGGDYITDEEEVRSLLQAYSIPESLVPYNSLEQ